MQTNPLLERHFNRFVLRVFGVAFLTLGGVVFVGYVFWNLLGTIPWTLALVLFCVSALTWLFGARAAMGDVIPDTSGMLEDASEEELRCVMSANPVGSDMHTLAVDALGKRQLGR